MAKKKFDIDEYQAWAFSKRSSKANPKLVGMVPSLTIAALGLAGESGEVADLLKKVIAHGVDLDTEVYNKIVKELGDITYYVAMAATALELDMSTILTTNIDKINARYPGGFTTRDSVARADEVPKVRITEDKSTYGMAREVPTFDRDKASEAAGKYAGTDYFNKEFGSEA